MSLRDFNAPVCDDPIALHHQPVGNATGLENFHTIHPEDIEPNNTPKIVGALAVALMIGAAGTALYTSISSQPPKPVTMAANLPAPAAPPAPLPAAVTPDANTPASMPAATEMAPTPAPVQAKSVSSQPSQTASAPRRATPSVGKDAASVRLAADATQSTVQPPAPVIAEPVAPTPSPSDIATNNIQSGVAVAPNATMAADMPVQGQASTTPQPLQSSTPSASDTAPAQDQQTGAAPAQ